VGAPDCPASLVEHGDACVATSMALPSVVPEPTQGALSPPISSIPSSYASGASSRRRFAESAAQWPRVAGDIAAPRQSAVTVSGEDEGLIMAAFIVFDVGWILGWLGTLIDEAQGGGCTTFSGTSPGRRVSCGGWAWSFAPFGGAMASAFTTPSSAFHSSGWGIGFSIPALILNAVGGVMSLIAFSNETTELGFRLLQTDQGLSATLSPAVQGGDAGLTLSMSF
jgi:hypothetical protein